MIDLFKFEDYIEYLETLFKDLQKKRGLSAREFGRMLGYQSPSFVKTLFSRKIGIHPKRARQVAHRIGLSQREIDYFETLVRSSKDQSPVLTEHLKALRSVREIKEFNEDWYDFFRDWRAAALFNLLGASRGGGSVSEIGTVLDTSSAEVGRMLTLLERLHLIERQGGRYRQVIGTLRTMPSVPVALRQYYKDLLEQAKIKIDVLSSEERIVQGLTFSGRSQDLTRVQEDIQDFICSMNRKYGGAKESDQVFHLGVQLIPLLR